MKRPFAVPAVAALLVVLVGCGTATTTGAPRIPGSPSTQASTAPAFDTSGSTVVIEIVAARATIAGPQGSSRIRVYGDGRVERTALDTISTEQLTVDGRGVTTLLADAERLGMLSDPDLGDVMITDVGSTSLTIRLQDRTIDLDVIGPGITGVGSPSVERARADFSAFVARVQSLDGIGVEKQPRTVHPRTVAVSAFRTEKSSSDIPWPLSTPARSVFAASSCVLVSGGDVQRLATMLAEQQRRRSSRGDGVVVATGDVGVPALRVRVSSERPQCTPAPMVRTPLPTLPWPADDRERAGQWRHWQAIGALERAMDRAELPASDLDDYEFEYVAGTVAGSPVVDVVATPDAQHRGQSDVRRFVARIDLAQAGGPAVTRAATA